MTKTTIEYKGQEFQVSYGYNEECELYEIMINPIHNEIVATQPVFLHRHPEEGYCEWRYNDIWHHPERYLKKIVVEKVLDDEEPTDFYFWQEFLDNMGIQYKLKFFEEKCYICIHHKYIKQVYGNTVELVFDNDGKFVEFQAWGE